MAGSFVQPTIPGYSPSTMARQDTPFLRVPGAQGQQEGVSQGQGLGFSPQQEFFAGGTEGTAPPSSIAPGNMWQRFGGGGEAASSLAQPDAGVTPQGGQQGFPDTSNLVAALMSPTAGYRPQPQPTARQAFTRLLRGY